ncbi:hypothetical protein DM860_017755 [Cuscuta australis]|uniref:Uncharacterized protein n=1 Tax=Cuscuta australis TaxID=267555 RepID=A0A328D6M9_9ASTE|nr:hypothetical protein DM860_017755 [Cuscuta australis]
MMMKVVVEMREQVWSPGGKSGWQPVMTGGDTTVSTYWLNWRVLLCCLWILMSIVFAIVLITKYEGSRKGGSTSSGNRRRRDDDDLCGQQQQQGPGVLYEDEVWKTSLKNVHPAWFLAFRIFAFVVLLVMLILYAAVDGSSIFYFYTQWTSTLLVIYFGLGSLLSMYGCYQYHNRVISTETHHHHHQMMISDDVEFYGSSPIVKHVPPPLSHHLEPAAANTKVAHFWGYIFQIIFQMNAGAVTLTDCVFWFVLVPYLTIKGYNLNFLIIGMHSINVVFLLVDTVLNCLRFPWFRIGYFFLWTAVYVIFQWALHACISIWWPYPFLDLSSPFAPLWYSSVALMHIPCYGIFVLVVKLKHHLLSKWFPHSFQCST